MTNMRKEILSQRQILAMTFCHNRTMIIKLANAIKKSKLKHFEIIARGSSRNACELFKYLLESNTDYRVSFVYPSTISKYHGTLNAKSIYLAVSQGGQGEDIKIVMDKAKAIKAMCIAITNIENTPINKIAKYNLYLKVNKEKSMAATKTFTAEMLLLAMLATALMGNNIQKYEQINKLILLVKQDKIKCLAKQLKNVKNLYVISRGKLLGIAKETCCKLQETCFINATAYASSDFMHGPLALIDKTSHVLFLIPNDQTKNDVVVLEKIVKANGAHTYELGGYKTNQEVYPFVMTYSIQLLAETLSQLLKCNPDQSRNLNKYTKTI